MITRAKAQRSPRQARRTSFDRNEAVGDALRHVAPDGLTSVVDVVGGPILLDVLPHLRDGGRVVVAGAVGGHTVSHDLRRLYLHDLAVVGSSMHTPRHFVLLVAEAREGTIRPRVAATYDLADIHRAQAAFAARDHVGKIVLRP